MQTYHAPPRVSTFTPGRVNLIGEHTDYNGGLVLPTANKLGATIALSRREDDKVNIASGKFDSSATRALGDAVRDHWSDYISGAVQFAHKTGMITGGADIYVETNLPFGAGLSSSASVIVGVLKLCRALSVKAMTDTEIAVLAQKVENEYIGVPCGIMDQMAVAISSPGQALALDTNDLNYELMELPTEFQMAVIHSGTFRKLSDGRYKIRKEECDSIKNYLNREDICEMTDEEFDTLKSLPSNIQSRAKHVITEHHRVKAAIKALRDSDMDGFGELMSKSHTSMRNDFDITLPQIDRLVEDAVKFGAKGARMTGGGFGGCIVACVQTEHMQNWCNDILHAHPKAFYVC